MLLCRWAVLTYVCAEVAAVIMTTLWCLVVDQLADASVNTFAATAHRQSAMLRTVLLRIYIVDHIIHES